MWSAREAGELAAEALRSEFGPDAAKRFEGANKPWYENIKPPSLERSLGNLSQYPWRAGRLMHVESYQVLSALALRGEKGDLRSTELLAEVARNEYGNPRRRMNALTLLAHVSLDSAIRVAMELIGDKAVYKDLASALVDGSRSPRLIPFLAAVAKLPKERDHSGAMAALASLGKAGVEAIAQACLSSPYQGVRLAGAHRLTLMNIATPAVETAVRRWLEHPKDQSDFVRASQLQEQLRSRGYRWAEGELARDALVYLDRAEGLAPPAVRPGFFKRLIPLLAEPPLIESSLLDWGRNRKAPISEYEKAAIVLTKLTLLHPELLYAFSERRVSRALGLQNLIGVSAVSEIEMWRAEQRDAKLVGPYTARLSADAEFRQKVRAELRKYS